METWWGEETARPEAKTTKLAVRCRSAGDVSGLGISVPGRAANSCKCRPDGSPAGHCLSGTGGRRLGRRGSTVVFFVAKVFRDNYGIPYDESGGFCCFLCGHGPTSGDNCRKVLLTFRRRRVVSACYSRPSLFPGNYKLECAFFLSFFSPCVSEERLVK